MFMVMVSIVFILVCFNWLMIWGFGFGCVVCIGFRLKVRLSVLIVIFVRVFIICC